MNRKVLLFGAIGIVAASVGVYVGNLRMTPSEPVPAVVSTLFQQTMPDDKGVPTSLAAFKGQPVLVNFWAPWCTPCVEEMPELSSLQTEVAPRKIRVIGIGIDSPSNIAEFSSKYKIAYPLFVAGMSGTELSRQFGNKAGGLPFTVLINGNGSIKKTYLGRLKMAEVRADLAAL